MVISVKPAEPQLSEGGWAGVQTNCVQNPSCTYILPSIELNMYPFSRVRYQKALSPNLGYY